ncbi:MAG TPA: hypothetical protein DEV98_05515 [Clostridiales bacterium]|nr:hypothetical protein [Clostridiales bacterium]
MHRGTAETTVPASEISEAERAVQNADFKALGTTLFYSDKNPNGVLRNIQIQSMSGGRLCREPEKRRNG